MAPDLNSLPPSPYRNHDTPPSPRRSSELRVPSSTSIPAASSHSPTSPFREHLPYAMSGHGGAVIDNTGVGLGPGPLRHPRPLTAADLHMQLEKEQEAAVNRLTRELTLLRQQTASVASNASSTSTGVADVVDQTANSVMSSTTHTTPSRRHRSSSSISRNLNTASSSGSVTTSTTAGVAGSSTSGIAPPRDVSIPYHHPRDPVSRQSSVASRRSEASSPSLSSSLIQGDQFPNMYAHRHSASMSRTSHPTMSQDAIANARPSQISSTRYDEATQSRLELEDVKKENEALKRRIRELERNLSARHQPEADRTRSGSVSTTASVPPGGGRERPLDNDDDAVKLGESAGSVGIGGGH